MQPRDFHRLAARQFDVLIVGGGIHGLMTAHEAAARGLTVALVDAGDFAAAASFNHQRTAHGGLRALQSGRLGLASESIRERRSLARLAPRLLRPLPFLIGTYRSLARGRPALAAGFRLDRWLGRHRNDGLEPELHLPAARLVSRAATLKLFPGIRQDGLTGGANWYDYQVVYTNRLAIAAAEAAGARGACLVNHARAIAAVRDGSRVRGMRVRDELSGAELEVGAALTINAAGAGTAHVMRMFGLPPAAVEVPLVRAMNLVTSKPASDMALAAAPAPSRTGSPGGRRPRRMLTMTPWLGRALVGTFQADVFSAGPDAVVTHDDVDQAVADANSAFPALALAPADVTLIHCANVPARRSAGGWPELLAAPHIRDHARHGVRGAMTLIGVKFTTARAVGQRAASAAARALGRPVRKADTTSTPLPGAGIADHEALAIETARLVHMELGAPAIRHLTTLYGDRCAPIVRLMAERREWRMPLVAGHPNVGAEVIHAIRAEMACSLADVVIRRTELGSMGHPGADVLAAAAAIAAEELGWDAARRQQEIAAVSEFYARGRSEQ